MGGRGSASAAGRSSNSKYNGFSVTDSDGNTQNYIVMNGIVDYADKSFLGVANMAAPTTMQSAYDTLGGVDGIIERINQNGIGRASVLTDTQVEKIMAAHKQERSEAKAQLDNIYSGNKKSVNRHRNFWSAM